MVFKCKKSISVYLLFFPMMPPIIVKGMVIIAQIKMTIKITLNGNAAVDFKLFKLN